MLGVRNVQQASININVWNFLLNDNFSDISLPHTFMTVDVLPDYLEADKNDYGLLLGLSAFIDILVTSESSLVAGYNKIKEIDFRVTL